MVQTKKNKQTNLDEQAMKIALGIKQAEQTKSQTKLVAQGIRKGIDIYKKQQNKKQRDIDKQKKKSNKSVDEKKALNTNLNLNQSLSRSSLFRFIPWILLLISWILFVYYFYYLS